MKKWEKPQVNNLSIEYTKNEIDSLSNDRGIVECQCCEPDNRYSPGTINEDMSNIDEIKSNLLNHKRTAHGYTGTNPFTSTCNIS